MVFWVIWGKGKFLSWWGREVMFFGGFWGFLILKMGGFSYFVRFLVLFCYKSRRVIIVVLGFKGL